MVLAFQDEPVHIETGGLTMEGRLWLPEEHAGVVLFVSGNGFSRVKPPNDYVASMLRSAHLGTLWLDLMPAQQGGAHPAHPSHPDIGILTERLNAACAWLRRNDATRNLPLGLFGVGACAAAAFQVAAALGRGISALVLRGARPELAAHGTLTKVIAPTLLIVGGLDDGVIGTNRAAYAALRCKKRFEIVPGATASFEEPGNLEVVARLARGWFLQHTTAAYI